MRYSCWMESRDVDIPGYLKDLTGRGSGCSSETPFSRRRQNASSSNPLAPTNLKTSPLIALITLMPMVPHHTSQFRFHNKSTGRQRLKLGDSKTVFRGPLHPITVWRFSDGGQLCQRYSPVVP